MKSDEKEPQKAVLGQYLRFVHVGFEFAVAVALFAGGGYWLDRRLGTGWIFTLLGLALGFAGAFRVLYKEVYGDGDRAGGAKGARRGAEPTGGSDARKRAEEDSTQSNEEER